tara:strand:+ start:868 stop:1002 length:135 start_codon:yes stop_codon:yes gene_type:complete
MYGKKRKLPKRGERTAKAKAAKAKKKLSPKKKLGLPASKRKKKK